MGFSSSSRIYVATFVVVFFALERFIHGGRTESAFSVLVPQGRRPVHKVSDVYRSRRVTRCEHSPGPSTWSQLCAKNETTCNYCFITDIRSGVLRNTSKPEAFVFDLPASLVPGVSKEFFIIVPADNRSLDIHFQAILTGPEVYPIYVNQISGPTKSEVLHRARQYIPKVKSFSNARSAKSDKFSVWVGTVGALQPGNYRLDVVIKYADGSFAEPENICRVEWYGNITSSTAQP